MSTTDRQQRQRFALVVEAPAGDEGVRKLRAFLKVMKRAWGIRCLSVAPVDPKPKENGQ